MVPTISLHMTPACQGLRSSADKFSAVAVVTTNSKHLLKFEQANAKWFV